jgi:hypothetical protein
MRCVIVLLTGGGVGRLTYGGGGAGSGVSVRTGDGYCGAEDCGGTTGCDGSVGGGVAGDTEA